MPTSVAIVGLGRIGLPLALSFADRGLKVIGIDKNPAVLQLWERYAAVCDCVPLVSLAESSTQFASFTPIDL